MDVTHITHTGDDLLVVNAARVSFDKESSYDRETIEFEERDNYYCGGSKYSFDKKTLKEGDKKLLRYLAEHKHWTPFSHPQITLRVRVPIFVARQLYKHKVGFTENEISRRYVDDKPEFYFPILRQRPDNGMKQGSKNELPVNLEFCESILLTAYNVAEQAYNKLLDEGVAPEQARMVLPQSMYTEFFWTGSLAAYARMCRQRMDEHAQAETREIAEKIANIIKPLFPESWRALVG